MNRRHFLQQAGLFATSGIVTIGTHGWAARAIGQTGSDPKRLIVIFLRGAVDGLSVAVPYQDPSYYSARPRIAIPKPGTAGGALTLNGQFGLHPALATLMPLWQQKRLAFVQCCGSPDGTRSHFDAQDYMESGTPGTKSTRDGWMNRLLATMSGRSPIQAVNVGTTTPRILSGAMPVATVATGRNAARPLPIDRPQVADAFDKIYSGNDKLSQVYKDAREAREALMQDLEKEMQMANNGAALFNAFPGDAQRLARLMARDRRIQLGFLAVGGWDTHVNQGATRGQLATRLQALARGLETLQKDLGKVYNDTTILVMSEFGRTVNENGNGGTDHGHGNLLWVMGGQVRGGSIHGNWRGLAANQLHEGRDLPVTTDFRDVVGSVLQGHLGLDRTQLSQVFPNYRPSKTLALV
jgi:uncharacterized protein (DUF1501 family)